MQVEKHKVDINIELCLLHGCVCVRGLERLHFRIQGLWTGSEPGTAGYLAGLSLARARDWPQFRQALAKQGVVVDEQDLHGVIPSKPEPDCRNSRSRLRMVSGSSGFRMTR